MVLLLFTLPFIAPHQPIRLHPQNPHCFLFRGKPAVLITSGEHYGAVLNGAFDFRRYLDELKRDGLNLTRTFSGVYREVPGNFSIAENTLAPYPKDFIAPWPRSSDSRAKDGLGRFDLSRWNEAYFMRLKEFIGGAGKQGIVVELVLFCPFYEDAMWDVSPMNAANNTGGIGKMPRTEVYTLKHPEMVALHDSLVRKLVVELSEYHNLYYEICNEPYFGGVTLEWQRHIAKTITDAESTLPHKHLIAQNIANGTAFVTDPDPNVSILNFHYANPPDAVAANYDLKRAISFNETGFAGNEDSTYRAQAWEFMMAGGAAFNNLDYSFTANHPSGDFKYPKTQPGGGSRELRKQLGILRRFLAGFNLVKLKPYPNLDTSGFAVGQHGYAISDSRRWGVYLHGGQGDTFIHVGMYLPRGRYRIQWINPRTGEIERSEEVMEHHGGNLSIQSHEYTEDVALRLDKLK